MRLDEYSSFDAVGLAAAIRSGEVGDEEVLDAALDALDAVHPLLNVVAHDLRDTARDELRYRNPDAPFSGVPFLVKDLSLEMAGAPNEAGSRLMVGNVSKRDHNLMSRFRTSGFLTVARTTTAEFGAQLNCESALTGVTRNPWSLDHTPGGSSGGSAASVAAGVVAVAHANDGIGSIRVPASNCGLFGLKLTRQRTPSGPDAGETQGGRGSEFVVSRTVRDSAAILDSVHGPDVGAPNWAPPPRRPYVDELSNPVKKLRIAVMTHTYSGAEVHPDCVAAVRATAALCADLGHVVDEAAPVFDWDAYRRAIRIEAFSNFSAGMRYFAGVTGRDLSSSLEPLNVLAVQEGASRTLDEYLWSIAAYGTTQRAIGAFFEDWDVLLTPVLSRPTARIGGLGVDPTDLEQYWDEFSGDAYSPFTGVFNITGHPAASLPLYINDEGLPIGSQLVGRFGDESTLLNLSAQLERAQPWIGLRPPVHVATLG
ncbi:amidase [uncultured Microbacterium sp.]|uniref:amidase n=1 Tax=uncultured Microbacterium sp. TaxID=191216 RepID=UPI0035CA44E9